jgi:hypothetical protein
MSNYYVRVFGLDSNIFIPNIYSFLVTWANNFIIWVLFLLQNVSYCIFQYQQREQSYAGRRTNTFCLFCVRMHCLLMIRLLCDSVGRIIIMPFRTCYDESPCYSSYMFNKQQLFRCEVSFCHSDSSILMGVFKVIQKLSCLNKVIYWFTNRLTDQGMDLHA